jgi:uncharacterized protein (TIGR03437 family)
MRTSIAIFFGLAFSLSLRGEIHSAELLSRQPLLFEKNQGQQGAHLQYFARGGGFELAVEPTENQISFAGHRNAGAVLRTRFLGAKSSATIQELDPAPARTSYFIGNQPSRWRRDVANFGKLQVSQIYRGVDLVFYGSAGTLEYDFIVHQGADPAAIRFQIDGAQGLRVDAQGDLVLATQHGEVRWKRPVLYQETGGQRSEIAGGFELHGRSIGFRTGAYDRNRSLVIDPALSYATYLGGTGSQAGEAIAMDAAGNLYITGSTTSEDMPVTKGAFQTAYGGTSLDGIPGDVFVAKLNSAGQLVYLTYLGGSGNDNAASIAVDSSGNAYITGYTGSVNFPTTAGVLQPKLAGIGGNSCSHFGDAFVAKLNSSGTQLVYSTYLGGLLDDIGMAIAIDGAGDAYVAGGTLSRNFPTTPGAYQTAFAGFGGQADTPDCGGEPFFDAGDAFVAKLNPTGSALLFSTYLGGKLDDMATSIAIDSTQNVYVAGATLSVDFPTSHGAIQTAFGGVDPENQFFHTGDGFLTKLNSTGSSLVYSTYLGGSGDDIVRGLVVDSTGTAYVTGATSSPNYPVTSGALQSTYGGYSILPYDVTFLVGDAFVTRVNATGTALLYSTYYGGSQNDSGTAIAVDSSGLIYVVGATDSYNFPITRNATQVNFGGQGGQFPYYYTGDGFLAVIDPNSTTPVFSTFYGGNLDDAFLGAVLDGKGSIWMTGNTLSSNLPITPNALQNSNVAAINLPAGDAMIVRISGFVSTISLLNGASFAVPPVAPGSLITIFGTFPGNTSTSAPSTPLPDTLGGASVTINGEPAPLNFVNATQINTQVPWDIAPGPATAIVTSGNVTSLPFQFTVGAANPGIFVYGANHAVAQNSNYTLNDTGAGEKVGGFVIVYMTGGGAVDHAIKTGAASPVSPVAYVNASSSATIGGKPADVLFLGMAPYFVGIVQADVTIPSLSAGDYPLVVTIDGVQSNAALVSVSGN